MLILIGFFLYEEYIEDIIKKNFYFLIIRISNFLKMRKDIKRENEMYIWEEKEREKKREKKRERLVYNDSEFAQIKKV